MKKYHATFALEDKMRESKASKEQIERRQMMMDEYNSWRHQVEKLYETELTERHGLRRGLDTDDGGENEDVEEETIEFLISVTDTVIEETD